MKKMLKMHQRVYKSISRRFGVQDLSEQARFGSVNMIHTMYRHALAPFYRQMYSDEIAGTLLANVTPDYALALTEYTAQFRVPFPAVIAWIVASQQPDAFVRGVSEDLGADVAAYGAGLFIAEYPALVSDTTQFQHPHVPSDVAALADLLLIATAREYGIV